ncbi:glycosyltransferase family A protein [uncultured Paracoccus sp.]|uniref:glycosyltransferase family 2 protein n=1 Tax=uncultured Paracoccus sp. TaxID=189685 RepID=UPI0025EBD36E|nr:glycosyltransferase family A protein [uncultured Paracoccus sp.]
MSVAAPVQSNVAAPVQSNVAAPAQPEVAAPARSNASAPVRLSIVVLSRHRPGLLALCLTALSQQDHPEYEVILVADPASVDTRPDLRIKRIAFDLPNVSAARNIGLGAAAGEVVAFIDDDALALPGWARRIAAPFADPGVIAAAGFTRGPDGLGWQVRAERLRPSGATVPVQVAEETALPPRDGCPVSTIGTNCAFRRHALLAVGGFDPAFAYHLDESDVNMRMARTFPEALTAIVPGAEVVHGIAAGPMRQAWGVPRDLTAVGHAHVTFARRHGGPLPPVEAIQRKRLLRHMVAGRLDPFALTPLLRGLREGRARAAAQPLPEPPRPLPDAAPGFLPLRPAPAAPAGLRLFSGWHWQAARLRRSAAAAVARGDRAAVLLLTPTFVPHRLGLRPGGWWEQHGGLWGGMKGGMGDSPPDPRFRRRAAAAAAFRAAMTRRLGDFLQPATCPTCRKGHICD